mmetsp:Transcript_128311/g.371444  ORF Transcript_128311/g.371444 Transcript_128311/m.371444 type:complete len:263 (+) Transcript_128311:1289-2077(+)
MRRPVVAPVVALDLGLEPVLPDVAHRGMSHRRPRHALPVLAALGAAGGRVGLPGAEAAVRIRVLLPRLAGSELALHLAAGVEERLRDGVDEQRGGTRAGHLPRPRFPYLRLLQRRQWKIAPQDPGLPGHGADGHRTALARSEQFGHARHLRGRERAGLDEAPADMGLSRRGGGGDAVLPRLPAVRRPKDNAGLECPPAAVGAADRQMHLRMTGVAHHPPALGPRVAPRSAARGCAPRRRPRPLRRIFCLESPASMARPGFPR